MRFEWFIHWTIIWLIAFGLTITVRDGNIGEGQNFILAAGVLTYAYSKWKV